MQLRSARPAEAGPACGTEPSLSWKGMTPFSAFSLPKVCRPHLPLLGRRTKLKSGPRLAIDDRTVAVDLRPVQGFGYTDVDDQQGLLSAADDLIAFARHGDAHADATGTARDQLHTLLRPSVVGRQQLFQFASRTLSNGDHWTSLATPVSKQTGQDGACVLAWYKEASTIPRNSAKPTTGLRWSGSRELLELDENATVSTRVSNALAARFYT